MRAITAIAARRLRAGWRGWAALALLTGLAGGAVLAATAGARRTESAFPRFLRETNAAEVLVGPALDGVRDGYDLAVGRLTWRHPDRARGRPELPAGAAKRQARRAG